MDANNTPAVIKQVAFWTSAKEGRLISLYSQFSLLWDYRHPDYYKRDRRDHAMRTIAASFNEFDVLSVKEKIKSLRDYFVKELKKEQFAARESPSKRYVSRWEHFNAWNFLRRVISSVPAALPTVNAPHVEIRPEALGANHVSTIAGSPVPMVLPLLPGFQSPARTEQASMLQQLPPRDCSQEGPAVKKPRLPESPPRSPSDLADITSIAGSLDKRPRLSSSPEVDPKPMESASSVQSGTHHHPSVTSEADSNGILGNAADARGHASMDNGGCAENLNLSSKDCNNAMFCGQLILELRKMAHFKRDFAKLRFMQILFDVKYKA